jgi:hypothetical protein
MDALLDVGDFITGLIPPSGSKTKDPTNTRWDRACNARAIDFMDSSFVNQGERLPVIHKTGSSSFLTSYIHPGKFLIA